MELPLYGLSLLTIYGNYNQVFVTHVTITGLISTNGKIVRFSQTNQIDSSGSDASYATKFILSGDKLLYLNVQYSNTAARLDNEIISLKLERGESGKGGTTYIFPAGIAGYWNAYTWPSKQDYSLNNLSRCAYQSFGVAFGTAGQQFQPGTNTTIKILAADFTLTTDATAVTRTIKTFLDCAYVGPCPYLMPAIDVAASSKFAATLILRGGYDFSNTDHYFATLPDKWLWPNEQLKFQVVNGQAGDVSELRVHHISISETI